MVAYLPLQDVGNVGLCRLARYTPEPGDLIIWNARTSGEPTAQMAEHSECLLKHRRLSKTVLCMLACQFTASWHLPARSGWKLAGTCQFLDLLACLITARTALSAVRSVAPWPRLLRCQIEKPRSAAQRHECGVDFCDIRRPVPSTSTRAVPAASATSQAENYSGFSAEAFPQLAPASGHTQKNGENLGGLQPSGPPKRIVLHLAPCSGPYFPRIFPNRVPEEEAGTVAV